MNPTLIEIVPPDTRFAFAAMRELRPNVTTVEAFVEQVDIVQRPAGYRLVGAFDGNAGEAAAAAGFRVSTSLSWGRFLYVDDLSTRETARGRGLARQLLDWLHEEAARLGCGQVHLDSGVGPHRQDAHRLYQKAQYSIAAHHFVRAVQ